MPINRRSILKKNASDATELTCKHNRNWPGAVPGLVGAAVTAERSSLNNSQDRADTPPYMAAVVQNAPPGETRGSSLILTILRLPAVKAQTGYSRSTIYLRVSQGLWPRPVSLGPR